MARISGAAYAEKAVGLRPRLLNCHSAGLALTLVLTVAAGVSAHAQSTTAVLPDAPSAVLQPADDGAVEFLTQNVAFVDNDTLLAAGISTSLLDEDALTMEGQKETDHAQHPKPPCVVDQEVEVDADCVPIPLNRRQPKRILGFMPNFRSVSGGATPHPPGWKYNFEIATHQSFDYSSFIFLGITSLSAEGINSHPVLGKGVHGFYSYTWRGFLDKTDGTYIGAWFLPSLLHEDTRYYAMGNRRSVPIRALYIMSRQVVTRTYGGRQTPNLAGLGGKVLTQLVSREYYPAGATSFSVLATKFAYSAMRDMAFTSIREFYPDIAAHYVRTHREKVARQAAKDAAAASKASPAPAPH